jgi:hypothetical protein
LTYVSNWAGIHELLRIYTEKLGRFILMGFSRFSTFCKQVCRVPDFEVQRRVDDKAEMSSNIPAKVL